MRKLITYMMVSIFLFLCVGETVVQAELIKITPAIQNTTRGIDISPDYVLALHTTDRFLHAWLMGDHKDGINYITDNLKQSVSEDELITFFSGTSNPHHMAYEVVGWRYVDENTIKFHVWLYEYITDESSNPVNQPEPFYIEVVKVDEGKWFVNTLPMRENYYNGADNI